MAGLKLTRAQLASFLKDHESIKQFEKLFAQTNENTDTLTVDLIIAVGNALTAASGAMDEVLRLKERLDHEPPVANDNTALQAVMSAPPTYEPTTLTAGSGLTGGGNMGGNVSLALAKAASYALFDHYATVGNGTTVETDLYSDTLAAGQLAANGDKLEAEYGGSFVSSGTATRQIKLYFGGTAIFDTGALTLSLSAAWTMYVSIIRVSSSVIRYMISLTTEGAALAAYTAVGELTGLTLANTQVMKITGQAAGVGAASNDILAKMATIVYVPAA